MELIIMMLVVMHVIGLFFIVRGIEYKGEDEPRAIVPLRRDEL